MKYFFCLAIGLSLAMGGFSQNPIIRNDSSTYQNNQPKVVVFNAPRSSAVVKKVDKNAFKLGLFTLFAGDMPIYYERMLSQKASLEVGVGLTWRHIVAEYMSAWDYGMYEPDADEYREFLLGYSFNVGVRYYPLGGMEDLYFMPDIRTRRYNSQYTAYNETTKVKEYVQKTDFKINVGCVSYLDKHVFLDYYAGVGIRHKSSSYYWQEYNYYSYGNPSGYEGETRRENKYAFAFMGGLKFGYAF